MAQWQLYLLIGNLWIMAATFSPDLFPKSLGVLAAIAYFWLSHIALLSKLREYKKEEKTDER